MVAGLPHNIERKLDQTIAQWRHWRDCKDIFSPPTVVKLLSTGMSNYSILVHSERDFVIRIDGLNPKNTGISRQSEWRALQYASARGLAPVSRYFNPELGSLVYDYLPVDENTSPKLDAVGTLLRKIHSLPPVHFRLELKERIIRYEKQCEQRGILLPQGLKAVRDPSVSLAEQLNFTEQGSVLCHNDLLAANRITTAGTLRAIDWEYCAMGSRWFDLAVICVGDDLDDNDTNTLLTAYLGMDASKQERHRLKQYQCVYRYIELLWHRALKDNKQHSEPWFTARTSQLRHSLESLTHTSSN